MTAAIALDLGTTTIKAGLLSHDGTLDGIVARPAPAIVAHDGRYESDALEYAETADAVLAECLAQTNACPRHGGAEPSGARRSGFNPTAHSRAEARPAAGNVPEVRLPLGLCSQRSSFLLWERANGQPVTPLISWQDDRGAASCADLRESEPAIRALTGLPLTPYYLAPKLRVLLREHPAWREKLVRGEWLLGTLDTFLIWRWTGGKCHQTDVSMAARTLLLDVHCGQWSPVLCALFDIPPSILPQITPSAGLALPLQNGLCLQAGVGDQSAALLAAISEGQPEALVNLGTGGFVVCFLPPGRSVPTGYLKTLVWQDAAQQMHLAAEGTLNSIAAALADYPVASCRAEDLAQDDIFCLAEPSGLGAPYFRSDLGLTFSAPVDHLPPQRIAALLIEGILFRVARILEDFQREFGLERVYLSGGLANLPALQQGLAQCFPLGVRPRHGGAEPSGAGAGATHFLPQSADLVGNVSEVRPRHGGAEPSGACRSGFNPTAHSRAEARPTVGNVSEVRPRHGGAEPSGAGAGATHFLPQSADLVGNVSEVRLLAQKEASLEGVARLAAGIARPAHGRGIRIDGGQPSPALTTKYQRWKAWLAQQLQS